MCLPLILAPINITAFDTYNLMHPPLGRTRAGFHALFGAMRCKTVKLLAKIAWKRARWRKVCPWLLFGPHGMQCCICRDAGIDSIWARGESTLALTSSFHLIKVAEAASR